jgi:hypothetical protein
MKFVRLAAPLLMAVALVVVPVNAAGALDVGTVHGTVSAWTDFHGCAHIEFGGNLLVGEFSAVGVVTSGGTTTPINYVKPFVVTSSPYSPPCSPAGFANPIAGDVVFTLVAATTDSSTVVIRTCEKTAATAFFCSPS